MPEQEVPPILQLVLGLMLAVVFGLMSYVFYQMESQEETDETAEQFGGSPIDFFFKISCLIAGCGWIMAVAGFMKYFFPRTPG